MMIHKVIVGHFQVELDAALLYLLDEIHCLRLLLGRVSG